MGGFDDVVERSADRARRLAKKRERDGLWVHAGVFDMRGEVGHLSDHTAGSGHGGEQVKGIDRHCLAATRRGGYGGPIGE
ncbi:Uncharacterised protein [Mycobacteroides abscessus]|nr:Uncharacterised protein [Mycobacteroides abscessus]